MLLLINWIAIWKVWFLGVPGPYPLRKTCAGNLGLPRFLKIPGSQTWPPGGPQSAFRSAGGRDLWLAWGVCRVDSSLQDHTPSEKHFLRLLDFQDFWPGGPLPRQPPRGAAAGPSRRWALLGRPNGLDFKSVNGALKMLLLINWIAKWLSLIHIYAPTSPD